MIICLAVGVLALGACAPPTSQLRLAPSGKLIPLVNGPEAGTAVGKCVQIGPGGPTTHPCPMDLSPLIDRGLRRGELGRGTYAHGIYIDPDALARAGGVDAAQEMSVTAYELATYHSTHAVWKETLEAKVASDLERLCADPASSDVRVIVREFEGCGMTMTGHLSDTSDWSISTLATQGTVLGQPRTFWSQDPKQALPPTKAKCAAARIVRVEVLPIQSLCVTMLRSAREGVSTSVALE